MSNNTDKAVLVTAARRGMKSWTYREITEYTEQQIKRLIEDNKYDFYREWAYGIYMFWRTLTMGWQEDGDDERLRALVMPED